MAGPTIMKSPVAPDEFSGKNKVLPKCRDYVISCSVPKRSGAAIHLLVMALFWPCAFLLFIYLFVCSSLASFRVSLSK